MWTIGACSSERLVCPHFIKNKKYFGSFSLAVRLWHNVQVCLFHSRRDPRPCCIRTCLHRCWLPGVYRSVRSIGHAYTVLEKQAYGPGSRWALRQSRRIADWTHVQHQWSVARKIVSDSGISFTCSFSLDCKYPGIWICFHKSIHHP